MPLASENHRQPQPIGSSDYLIVAERAARLDHRRRTSGSSDFDTIGEREERIAGNHRALSDKPAF